MQFPQTTTIELHHQGVWTPAAQLRAVGNGECRIEYLPEYVFGDAPQPVSLGLPVEMRSPAMVDRGAGLQVDYAPAPFLYDLVPQGRGRRFLLDALQLGDSDSMVLPLLMAGAFNPIGNLRIASAVDFYQEQVSRMGAAAGDAAQGFTLDDMRLRSADYLEHIALHAMLAAGTTGVQGVAPKFLLATDAQGHWFADMALPDAQARAHWLLKLPRGKADEDRAVLRSEAAYLRLAKACGLRVHADPMLLGDMLFVQRFDRVVDAQGVQRLPQESLASIAGLRGFGAAVSQNQLLAALRHVATHPLAETIEFIKRDVLNSALRNTDNHARNTAVQTLANGCVQLTPLFDFAPMFMDPELVPRSCHWLSDKGARLQHWQQVVDALEIPDVQRSAVISDLVDFSKSVANLPIMAADAGVDAYVIEQCRKSIDAQVQQLSALATAH